MRREMHPARSHFSKRAGRARHAELFSRRSPEFVELIARARPRKLRLQRDLLLEPAHR